MKNTHSTAFEFYTIRISANVLILQNIEGRIDVYEQFGQNTTLSLRIARTVGFFGAVTVVWQADPREATLMDYSPESGTVNFANNQREASILVTILDDNDYEPMEVCGIYRCIGLNLIVFGFCLYKFTSLVTARLSVKFACF